MHLLTSTNKMGFLTIIRVLLASPLLVAAVPGYTAASSSLSPHPTDDGWSKGTCSNVLTTKTATGTTTTTQLTTKTKYIPITTIVSGALTTIVDSYPVTNVSTSTKFITTTEYTVVTKTYPVTTVIYSTAVESSAAVRTISEVVPVTSVGTSYKTAVTNVPSTVVTSTPSTTVYTETQTLPYTSIIVKTDKVCTSKGYGHGY